MGDLYSSFYNKHELFIYILKELNNEKKSAQESEGEPDQRGSEDPGHPSGTRRRITKRSRPIWSP